jgi:predicted DNA-binding transcriptional regulator AlpA
MENHSLTIPEFCESERISRAHYFNMRSRGEGPREMRIGKSVRISPEARADWRREREVAA